MTSIQDRYVRIQLDLGANDLRHDATFSVPLASEGRIGEAQTTAGFAIQPLEISFPTNPRATAPESRITQSLTLPSRTTPQGTSLSHAPSGNDSSPGTLRVLLVDHDSALRTSMGGFIRRSGAYLAECSTANEALSVLHTQPSFDLALIEIELPDRPGWQLWNRLSTDSKQPKALFWCHNHEVWSKLSLRNNPRVHFLGKPFSKEDLRHALGTLARGRS